MHEEFKQYLSLTLKTLCCEKYKRWFINKTLLILKFDKIKFNIFYKKL